jgi:hypothetical protein
MPDHDARGRWGALADDAAVIPAARNAGPAVIRVRNQRESSPTLRPLEYKTPANRPTAT